MPRTLGWWSSMDGILPNDEELAGAVAAELGEPLAEVRPSVLIATLIRRVDASLADLHAVVEGERDRARIREAIPPRPVERRVKADTLDDLLAETRRLSARGALDLGTAIAVQRAAGAIAARSGLRLVLFMARLAVIRRLAWEACVHQLQEGRLDGTTLGEIGRWIFMWTEATSLVVTDGYRTAEREILARDAQARRSALEEILGVIAADALTESRLRRVAARFGMDPDDRYRMVAIAPDDTADPTPGRTGIDQDDLELLAGRIGHLVGAASSASEGAGAGIRLPTVLPMRGRLVLLARADWPGLARMESTLDAALGGPHAGRAARQRARPAWVAVASPVAQGAEALAGVMAELIEAVRTAEVVGLRGLIGDPGDLAVERLLLASRDLGEAAVQHELGPLLADERLGPELVETLQVYFDSGENMREAARRLHLANRTIAYRLERIESLLGSPIDDARRRRLAVALLVRRLQAGSA